MASPQTQAHWTRPPPHVSGYKRRSARGPCRVSNLPTLAVFVWAELVLPPAEPLSVSLLGEDGGRGREVGGAGTICVGGGNRFRVLAQASLLRWSTASVCLARSPSPSQSPTRQTRKRGGSNWEASAFCRSWVPAIGRGVGSPGKRRCPIFLSDRLRSCQAASIWRGRWRWRGTFPPRRRSNRQIGALEDFAWVVVYLPLWVIYISGIRIVHLLSRKKMAFLSGNLHRPLSAVAVVAVAAVSSEISDKFTLPKSDSVQAPPKSTLCDAGEVSGSWVSRVSISNISAGARAWNSVDEIRHPSSNSDVLLKPGTFFSLFSSKFVPSPAFLDFHRNAKLGWTPQSVDVAPPTLSSDDVMYRWHLPKMRSFDVGKMDCSAVRSRTVVVLLGWLGAKQKHLKRYADWYTSRGFHVVTFTLPLADILSYNVGGKAEENVVSLANHLSDWVSEEQGKNLVFHTFSNTGWIMYGVILENFKKQDPSLMEKIKGCIVDSAPVAAPDPQVWASGFSAAFLKKQSVATKGMLNMNDSSVDVLLDRENEEPKPAVAETALLTLLEKFFKVVLNLPSVNRRLTDVLDMLSSDQPKCPQLYVYSSSDRVIPAKSVESFVEHQRKAGHEVKAYDFVSSPHVDHFRSHPTVYTSQLTSFLDDHVFTCCKDSS